MKSIEKGLSIVVPAYNEENGISSVLDELFQVTATFDFPLEIIVVDDGSADKTGEIIKTFREVELLTHQTNRGYGAAVKTGIRAAKYDLVCITDADGTYPNEKIDTLVTTAINGDFDMVVGARIGDNVSIPIIRRPAKWAIRKLAEYISGESILDINSGLRVFKKSAANRLLSLLPNGFSLTTTITLGMLSNGYNVKYLPIDYHGRIGNSKIKPIRDTLGFIQLILRMGLYFSPLKVFLPISSVFVMAAILAAIISTYIYGRLADVTTLVLLVTGIQIGALSLIAELINHRVPNDYREHL